MKNLLFALLLVFIFFSCDTDGAEKEANPYPDGVYPFEVTGVGYSIDVEENTYTITWTNPIDKNFKDVQFDEFIFNINTGDHLIMYSSYTDYRKNEYWIGGWDYFLSSTANSFTFRLVYDITYQYTNIKCVDKFGNISQGIKYEYQLERKRQ